jgi:hypothetical protein
MLQEQNYLAMACSEQSGHTLGQVTAAGQQNRLGFVRAPARCPVSVTYDPSQTGGLLQQQSAHCIS